MSPSPSPMCCKPAASNGSPHVNQFQQHTGLGTKSRGQLSEFPTELPDFTQTVLIVSLLMGTTRLDSSQCLSSQMGIPWLPCFSILPWQRHQASSLPASPRDPLLARQADVLLEIRPGQEQLLAHTAVPVLWGRGKTDSSMKPNLLHQKLQPSVSLLIGTELL